MISAAPFAVTVTYGQRRSLLEKMLEATFAEGVQDIVVVDNGATWNVRELITLSPDRRLHIVSMEANLGSAAGFSAGISAAMQAGAPMIWLLDDDNRPMPGALQSLLDAHIWLKTESADREVAVLAYRPEHQADVAKGNRVNPRRSSFLGFHVLDLPFKLWKRRPWRDAEASSNVPLTVDLDVAPYSGLLLQRKTIETIGLPRADFVLYADDTEFSHRIIRKGGRIVLVTAALFEDMESSWNVKERNASSIHGLLSGTGDFRVYYGLRNAAYFQAHCAQANAFAFWVNRRTYMLLLHALALVGNHMTRYRLIKNAVSDGLGGRLGLNKDFPL